jgi:hypothetical protein
MYFYDFEIGIKIIIGDDVNAFIKGSNLDLTIQISKLTLGTRIQVTSWC